MYSVNGTLTRFITPALLFSVFSQPLLANEDERMDRLEQRLDSLQKQVTESSLEKVRLNGFFSLGYSRASNNAGFDEAVEASSLDTLSLMGLQATFSLGRRTDAVLQLVSRGADDWDTELEWGYLRHQFTGGAEVRAGKMRLPLFMESETLGIGYGQLWARPPEAVYDPVPLRSYLGADTGYTFNFRSSSVEARLFAGHVRDDAESLGRSLSVELRNVAGLTANWTNYLWTLRAVYAAGEASIGKAGDPFSLGQDESAGFTGLGASHDDGHWLLMSELTRVKVDGLYQDTDSAYLTLGYRIREVTPYVTASWVESRDNDARDGTPFEVLDTRRQSYSLGFRWDMMASVALKADWTHARGFGNTTGGLIGNQLAIINGIRQDNRFDSTNVYTLRLDAAF